MLSGVKTELKAESESFAMKLALIGGEKVFAACQSQQTSNNDIPSDIRCAITCNDGRTYAMTTQLTRDHAHDCTFTKHNF